MSNQKNNKGFKEFFLSSTAIDNRITIYVLTFLVVLIGYAAYVTLPKENFPEVQIPTIYVGTAYPGTSPGDIENLVTRKIEKEIKAIKGVKEIKSNSIQDFSVVVVEFETSKDLKEAKREVQEAVDRSKSELPGDLPADPNVQDINLSEIPIMYVNVYGDADLVTLKRYAEDLKDDIETLPEINRVDIVGALDREIQVNLDLYKMEVAGVSFGDVERVLASENVIISGGEINMDGVKRAIRVNGEFESIEEIQNLIVKGVHDNPLYLKNIAEVKDGFEKRSSYARLDGETVITLNVVKKAGENLVEASEKIIDIVEVTQEEDLPANVDLKVSGDQSVMTKRMLGELINTIIIGFILVTLVLMFFMGLRDATFVGLSVPLSSLIAFAVLPAIGFTMNMVVLFAFILALGIVVDNAIVVIENTYRIFNQEKLPIVEAAKKAAGEVIGPVFSGTLTTLAPFVPLAFWDGIIGEFMFFLPITIIITLSASLLVAYVINPVFAVSFMKRDDEEKKFNWVRTGIAFGLMAIAMALGYISGNKTVGHSFMILLVFSVLYAFALRPLISKFQSRVVPWFVARYRAILDWSLKGARPTFIILGTVFLLFFANSLFVARAPKVVFFPESDPNFVYIYNSMPIGTDIEVTDSVTNIIERRVMEVLGDDNPVVKSVITNVALGAGDPNDFTARNSTPHKSRLQVEFVEFKKRDGISTSEILEQIRKKLKGIPGTQIVVDKESSGPPTAKPINIEVSAEEFPILVEEAAKIKAYLDSLDIDGVEELKWDLELGKPEVVFNIDRPKASELGISSAQVGMALRTSVFGKEASKFRELEDEYPIQIRLAEKYREDVGALLNQKLIYRNMANGQIYEVPISAVADIEYTETFGGINRIDLEKVVTISSNVLTEYNPNEVVDQVKAAMREYFDKNEMPEGVSVDMTGEQEEQAETMDFLLKALGASCLMIILILIAQFNSIPKVAIIFFQIILSLIGVLLGFAITGQDMSIVMTGVGIISLAGVVVNNGIIMLEFIQQMRDRGMTIRKAIVEGGSTRFTPVILTAASTILGLIPMAIAMNINFPTIFSDLDPQIFFGGDNAAFWGPLAWTIIYGLSFATVVTLLVLPVIYFASVRNGIRFRRLYNRMIYKRGSKTLYEQI